MALILVARFVILLQLYENSLTENRFSHSILFWE